eukprot:scaffold62261_cov23-Tisochrysis_lutea.AAC.1
MQAAADKRRRDACSSGHAQIVACSWMMRTDIVGRALTCFRAFLHNACRQQRTRKADCDGTPCRSSFEEFEVEVTRLRGGEEGRHHEA